MESEIHARHWWVKLYEETNKAGLVCRRCGISRPALRKWWKRYQEHGIRGLQSHSRKPKTSPAAKIGPKKKEWILDLRNKRKLSSRRIQGEIKRLHNFFVPLTNHKVRGRSGCKPLQKPCRKKDYKRYS